MRTRLHHISTLKAPPLLTTFLVLLFAGAMALALVVIFADSGERASTADYHPDSIPLAVLGDSDSHSYQDRESFPPGSKERGGEYRAMTFNWPEVLARLRGDQLDLGQWGVWGPDRHIAKARELLGLPVRRPRKEDFRYNFAVSGASCRNLNAGWRQVDRLLKVMALDPVHWRQGIVVIRIGIVDFGGTDHLDAFAEDAEAPAPSAALQRCLQQITTAVRRIRADHPTTRFVLVGILSNADWARMVDRWQSASAQRNIKRSLDRFDDALRALAEEDDRVAFFDDRQWFHLLWGGRDENGAPAYRSVVLPHELSVSNTEGDNPANAVLADGHAGVVWNLLWAKALVGLLNAQFELQLRPIEDAEVLQFLERIGAAAAMRSPTGNR